jgi:hypothetical protein
MPRLRLHAGAEVARMSDDPATESDPLLAVRHTPRSTPALVI